jgi:uncharacterized protein (DUF1697 family)
VTHVVLLRGVNVGSHGRITMAELRRVLAAAGYGDPRTLGQSGNVVLETRKRATTLARELGALLDVGVVVRTRDELASVVVADPLASVRDSGSRHLVTFLSGRVPAALARAARAAASASERVAVRGAEIHSWHPDGLHDSQLAKLLAVSPPGLVATARNWNTVTKLLALAEGPGRGG